MVALFFFFRLFSLKNVVSCDYYSIAIIIAIIDQTTKKTTKKKEN